MSLQECGDINHCVPGELKESHLGSLLIGSHGFNSNNFPSWLHCGLVTFFECLTTKILFHLCCYSGKKTKFPRLLVKTQELVRQQKFLKAVFLISSGEADPRCCLSVLRPNEHFWDHSAALGWKREDSLPPSTYTTVPEKGVEMPLIVCAPVCAYMCVSVCGRQGTLEFGCLLHLVCSQDGKFIRSVTHIDPKCIAHCLPANCMSLVNQ